MKVSIKITEADLQGITDNLREVVNDDQTMLLIHALFAQTIDPYVPYDTGYLSKGSVEIESDGVVYTAEYAQKQYYGDEFRHKTEVHPLATAFWDRVAMQTELDSFAEGVKEIILRRLGNG
jgi:hypothetical protein